ncbi:ATP synthase regulation protein nca2 [Zymoseptoria brevis]|uniref:ATP synthase regulation protein nca2 n=1 Tax=Zymoseptoria brevis TaxID=1047168 RepID=A0A0F4GXC3_9PEZI|nr:ATP synthase regulation protein nca2 [Zymoseptoria brevis]
MSFITDTVRRIDAQLDRLQLTSSPPTSILEQALALNNPDEDSEGPPKTVQPSPRLLELQAAIRALSPGGPSEKGSLLRLGTVQTWLGTLSGVKRKVQEDNLEDLGVKEQQKKDEFEAELEWLLVSKATTQVYGHVLRTILDEAVSLSEDLWYWDEVLWSQRYTALYGIQTSPERMWGWGTMVWADVKTRTHERGLSMKGVGKDAGESFTARWKVFYGLVRQVVREKSVKEVHTRILSPVTRLRAEVRQKQAALKKMRGRNANALGVLLGEGLANESSRGDGLGTPRTSSEEAGEARTKWKTSVARNVALMEAVLAKINDLETPVDKFDSAIAECTDEDPLYTADVRSSDGDGPAMEVEDVAARLSRVLGLGLEQYAISTRTLKAEHGKPSRLVRYWLAITAGILSSSTILRMLVNRQTEILQWIQDLGSTIVDFWRNWVVEPTRKVIGTIRHDESSEISIMSKRSLTGDRESLERMVVDFAIDNPAHTTGSSSALTESQIDDLRTAVREGDLTPVLKAYEKDLTSPVMGALKGNLVRALLIQIQKTKVDVEVAMGGIDSLLKSQELLIGFISLTPGLLMVYGVTHWVRSSFITKRGSHAARKQGVMLRQLRNVDRILTGSTPTEYGELMYKDQGLLLCEVSVLREAARKVMPERIWREFGTEVQELCDVRVGVERQMKVAERVRWAYGRWLS